MSAARPRARRAALVLALLLAWAGGGAAVLDGWLHATRGDGVPAHASPDACAWCRLADAPRAPAPDAPDLAPASERVEAELHAPAEDAPRTPPRFLAPPARAPPRA